MKVTEVRLNKVEADSLKAYASITFDSVLVVKGVKVLTGQNGLFVKMPQKKLDKPYTKNGREYTYDDIVFPLSKELREHIQTVVLAKYNEMEGGDAEQPF